MFLFTFKKLPNGRWEFEPTYKDPKERKGKKILPYATCIKQHLPICGCTLIKQQRSFRRKHNIIILNHRFFTNTVGIVCPTGEPTDMIKHLTDKKKRHIVSEVCS